MPSRLIGAGSVRLPGGMGRRSEARAEPPKGSLEAGESHVAAMRTLAELCERLIDNHIADQILRPLQETIAIQ